MRFWPIFLFILASCEQRNESMQNAKCLSCNFFLGKRGDDNYVILQENTGTQKIKVLYDSVANINGQNCRVFFHRRNEYIVVAPAGDSISSTSFQSQDEMFEYLNKDQTVIGDHAIPSAESMYEMLPPRISCK